MISIVTPNLNQGRYIEETLLSVLSQGYPRLEYVVQDGGSTDASVETIRRYADRLASWQSAADNGQTHAINLGLQRTTGDIMAYVNSDDVLLPGALRYVARYLLEGLDKLSYRIRRWLVPHGEVDPRGWLRRVA